MRHAGLRSLRRQLNSVKMMPAVDLCHSPGTDGSGAVCVPGGVLLVPESLDDLVTTKQAADECGVTVAAISNWKSRGYIQPSGLDERHRPMYKRIDVLRAARDTRRRAVGVGRTA